MQVKRRNLKIRHGKAGDKRRHGDVRMATMLCRTDRDEECPDLGTQASNALGIACGVKMGNKAETNSKLATGGENGLHMLVRFARLAVAEPSTHEMTYIQYIPCGRVAVGSRVVERHATDRVLEQTSHFHLLAVVHAPFESGHHLSHIVIVIAVAIVVEHGRHVCALVASALCISTGGRTSVASCFMPHASCFMLVCQPARSDL